MSAPIVRLPRATMRQLRGAAFRGIVPAAGACRTYTLPWPPSVNDYYEHSRHGGVHVSARGRAYWSDVRALVRQQERRAVVPWAGPVAVLVVGAHPADGNVHDGDNILKALFDSLTRAHVWEDDSQVRAHVVDTDCPPKGAGCVRVWIEPKRRGRWVFVPEDTP